MDALNKRYAPILIVCGALAVLAMVGQLTPAPSQETPVRLRLDNKGGDVVLAHTRHTEDYGVSCETCHHESETPSPDPTPCGACHPADFDDAWLVAHQQDIPQDACAKCHHAVMDGLDWSHQDHIDLYSSDCTDCHHGPDIEPEPMACGDCHMEEGDDAMPSLRDAGHQSCITCHSDQFDAGLEGCSYCHEITPVQEFQAPAPACSQCHYDAEEPLIPARMEAFHQSCMGCHEELGAGPYGEDSCNRCHTR